MALKRKAMAGAAALALAALIATGTFAWTSLNSQKINEWFGTGTKPGTTAGGTLHDDYIENQDSKQVYVENWGDEDLFVRIKLTEYMEIGQGAGLKSIETDLQTGKVIPHPDNKAGAITTGSINNLDSWENPWRRFIEVAKDPLIGSRIMELFHFWTWEMGGQKYYYPAPEGSREDKAYVDQNSPNNLTANSVNSNGIQAKQTRKAMILTITEWFDSGSPIGDYWVVDKDPRIPSLTNDIWIYWAAPLKPGEATGLLMNKVIKQKWPSYHTGASRKLDEDYYYGINVEAQMATKDGEVDSNGVKDNYERFGDADHGGWTEKGQKLMEIIVGNETPKPPDAYITVNGATVIDNIIYAKPGQNVELVGTGTASENFTLIVDKMSVNYNSVEPGSVDRQFYAITVQSDKITNILVFKNEAPIGYQLRIKGVISGFGKYPNFDGYIFEMRNDSLKTAVVIPQDCLDVVKGSDGKIYLTYENGTYREFADDGTVGPEINALP